MKTPPLLLFATLAFWGWQSNLLLYGALAGAVLEASRFVKLRWELEDVDFNRIWSLCILIVVVLGAYVFTTSDQGGGLHAMFGSVAGIRRVSDSSTVATTSVFRWLPLICLPFVVAQVYNVRPTVPLTAVSLVLRIRRRRGEQALAGHYLDISYPYFILCIFSAGVHANQGTHSYFWGQALLILWVLWTLRSRRFGLKVWLGCLAVVILVGFLGQVGINQFERLVQDFDAKMFSRFFHPRTDPSQSVTALGHIGDLKLSPRIVIRLEPGRVGVVPSYLHEASYRNYNAHNQSWLSGGSMNDFAVVPAQSDGTTWVLLPAKKLPNTINIACYLGGRSEQDHVPEGILPLPSGACRLENLPNISSIRTNQTGAVLATGFGLMIFDARYGPGMALDSPPDTGTNHFDLVVPTNEIPALEHVVAEMNLTNASDGEKRLAVQQFFARHFTYSSWQGLDKQRTTSGSPLTHFLLTSRSGHCEYFATATVLLLRELGIPARYAVGFSVHEASGSGYVVRERDAHAWCLAWNRQTHTWDDFDTTPASWIAIEGRNASPLDVLSDVRSWLVFQFEKLRWRQADLRPYILWTCVPVMVVLLYYIFFQRRHRRGEGGRKGGPERPVVWPGHDSAFYRLEAALDAGGIPRQPHEPLADWLERALADANLAALRGPLRELLHLHYRYRFDPLGLSETEKKALLQNAEAILETLARGPVR